MYKEKFTGEIRLATNRTFGNDGQLRSRVKPNISHGGSKQLCFAGDIMLTYEFYQQRETHRTRTEYGNNKCRHDYTLIKLIN